MSGGMSRQGWKRTARLTFNRIVGIIIMAIVTTSVLSACGVRPEERESRAEAALLKKYGKEFEVLEVYPQKFGELYYEVLACPVDDPLLRFSAAIDTEDENISDSYVERRVCAAIAREAEKNLDQLPGCYYLAVFAGGPQPRAEDPDISIQDYAALDPLNMFQAEVFVMPEKADAEALFNSISGIFDGMRCFSGTIRLYLVKEEEMDAAQTYLEANDGLYSEYLELTKDFFRLEIPYQNGTLAMSAQEFAEAVKEVL